MPACIFPAYKQMKRSVAYVIGRLASPRRAADFAFSREAVGRRQSSPTAQLFMPVMRFWPFDATPLYGAAGHEMRHDVASSTPDASPSGAEHFSRPE